MVSKLKTCWHRDGNKEKYCTQLVLDSFCQSPNRLDNRLHFDGKGQHLSLLLMFVSRFKNWMNISCFTWRNSSDLTKNEDMSKYKRTMTAPSSGSCEHLDTLKPAVTVSISEPMLKISVQDRKKSMTPSLRSRGSGTGSGGSTFAAMGARRMSRRLSTRPVIKREDTQGSSLNLQSMHIRQEPTYKMEPDDRFSVKSVEDIIKETLERSLDNYTYDKRQTPTFGKILSDDIKDRVKRLNFERYKIVCMLVIGENQGQGLQMSSRCQWFPKTDTFASYTYKNTSVFCSCTVYGIYAEWEMDQSRHF